MPLQYFEHRLATMFLAAEGEELDEKGKSKRLENVLDFLVTDTPKLSRLCWSTLRTSEVLLANRLLLVVRLVCAVPTSHSMPHQEVKRIRTEFKKEVGEVRMDLQGAIGRIREALAGALQPGDVLLGPEGVTVSAVRRRVKDSLSEFARVWVPEEASSSELIVGELPIVVPRSGVIEIEARVRRLERGHAVLDHISVASGDRSRIAKIPLVLRCRKMKRQRESPAHCRQGAALQLAMDTSGLIRLHVALGLSWVDASCLYFVLVDDQPWLDMPAP